MSPSRSFTRWCCNQGSQHLLFDCSGLRDFVKSQPPLFPLPCDIRHNFGSQLLGPLDRNNTSIIALPTVIRAGEYSNDIAGLTNSTEHWLMASDYNIDSVLKAEFVGTVLTEFDCLG